MRPESILWVCPGQGQQASVDLNALRPMPEDAVEAHTLWETLSELLGEDAGQRWQALSIEARENNQQAQWGLMLYQVLRGLRARGSGIPMDWIVGYSAGELSAYALAGSIPIEMLPKLMLTRAELMSSAVPNPKSQPCLVLLSEALPPQARERRRQALLDHGLKLAIQRSRAESVWGGLPDQVSEFMRLSQAAGWGARPLAVSIPSHTLYLEDILKPWAEALNSVSFAPPQVGVLAGLDGRQIQSAEAARESLLRQIANPIAWDQTLSLLPEYGVTHVLDLGPGDDQWRLLEAIDSSLMRIEI